MSMNFERSALNTPKKEKLTNLLDFKFVSRLKEKYPHLLDTEKEKIEKTLSVLREMSEMKRVHSMNVALRALRVSQESSVLFGALLHDAPERVPKQYHKIMRYDFPAETKKIIDSLSVSEKGKSASRKDIGEPLEHIRYTLPVLDRHTRNRVILIKLSDRLDNLRRRIKNKIISEDYLKKSKALFKYLASEYEQDENFDEYNLAKIGEKLASIIGCVNYIDVEEEAEMTG